MRYSFLTNETLKRKYGAAVIGNYQSTDNRKKLSQHLDLVYVFKIILLKQFCYIFIHSDYYNTGPVSCFD